MLFTRTQEGDELYNPRNKTRFSDNNLDGKVDKITIDDKEIKRTKETENEFQKADEKWGWYFKDMQIRNAINDWKRIKEYDSIELNESIESF